MKCNKNVKKKKIKSKKPGNDISANEYEEVLYSTVNIVLIIYMKIV
ncbi:MAG: hypothetical protein IJE05_00690 [Clostridia bacterium]|nr:hypothetical protein [Clostridia bacterium]